jgi:hypothetical protein
MIILSEHFFRLTIFGVFNEMTLEPELGFGNCQNVVLNHLKGPIVDTPLFFQIYARTPN